MAAPPFPISIVHLLSLIVGWEGGAGGAVVRSVDIYYYDEVFMFLLTTCRYVCREIYIFVACRIPPKYRQSGPDVRVRVTCKNILGM